MPDPFKEEETNSQPNPDQGDNSGNPFADKLGAIKNEKGEPKYKSVEDALEALAHSQNFIETLKAEKAEEARKRAEVEEELNKRASVEDFVNKLTKTTDTNTPAKPTSENEGKSFDPNDIAALVEKKLADINKAQMAERNKAIVIEKLSEKFGNTASEVVKEKAKQLGTTPAALEELSKQNPTMVLALFDGVTPGKPKPTESSVTSQMGLPKEEPLKFEKSLMRGGLSNKELTSAFRQIAERTNKRLGVEG